MGCTAADFYDNSGIQNLILHLKIKIIQILQATGTRAFIF